MVLSYIRIFLPYITMVTILHDSYGCVVGIEAAFRNIIKYLELLNSVIELHGGNYFELVLMSSITSNAMNLINSDIHSSVEYIPRIVINVNGSTTPMFVEFDIMFGKIRFRLYQQHDRNEINVEQVFISLSNSYVNESSNESSRPTISPHEILHVIYSYVSKHYGHNLILHSVFCHSIAEPTFNTFCKIIFHDYIQHMTREYQDVPIWHLVPATAILFHKL